MAKKRDYALSEVKGNKPMPAPALDYLPRGPRRYQPRIGLIACGGITSYHLKAYRSMGWDVVALCDPDPAKARERQKEFYPSSTVCTDYRDILRRDDIDVVDIATHPAQRVQIIKDAIVAGKHILSQKPFVTDLDTGEKLVELAEKKGVRLAVNQNGRWAPHFAYIRAAIAKGLLGEVFAGHLEVHWDHNWIGGTPFENVCHIVLYDFAIHWFDLLTCFMGDRIPKRVFATSTRSPSQAVRPPLLGQAMVEYDGAQGSLVFDADVKFGKEDRAFIAGDKGTILSTGPSLQEQSIKISTARGYAMPELTGTWFDNGFAGTMAELLRAIEENRQPSNSARGNLKGLALCFAACASADRGKPMVPGKVRRIKP